MQILEKSAAPPVCPREARTKALMIHFPPTARIPHRSLLLPPPPTNGGLAERLIYALRPPGPKGLRCPAPQTRAPSRGPPAAGTPGSCPGRLDPPESRPSPWAPSLHCIHRCGLHTLCLDLTDKPHGKMGGMCSVATPAAAWRQAFFPEKYSLISEEHIELAGHQTQLPYPLCGPCWLLFQTFGPV